MIYIYGDATAKHRDTNLQQKENFYTIFCSELNLARIRYELRVPGLRSNKILDARRKHVNPNVKDSADFINEIYESNLYAYEITINESCKISINDYINYKQAPDGSGLKEKDSQGAEKYGHLSDTKRYFICEFVYDDYMKYLNKKPLLL